MPDKRVMSFICHREQAWNLSRQNHNDSRSRTAIMPPVYHLILMHKAAKEEDEPRQQQALSRSDPTAFLSLQNSHPLAAPGWSLL